MRRITAFALMGILALAACSSSDPRAEPLEAKRAASTAASTSTTLPFAADTAHTPGTLEGFVGAKADVHDTTCRQHRSTWRAEGKVTNRSEAKVKYRIYVSFLQGDTTVGLTETDFGPVARNATRDWSASIGVKADGLRCILRVERGDV